METLGIADAASQLDDRPIGRSNHRSLSENRIKAAKFLARTTIEEFDFTFQRSVRKPVAEHLARLDFLHEKSSVVAFGPPGTGKTHLAVAICFQNSRSISRRCDGAPGDLIGDRPVSSFIYPAGLPHKYLHDRGVATTD